MSPGLPVIAHRGASAHAVDNSIDAFAKAIDAGADMVEFDVRRTADDQLIAFHDPAVGRVPVGQLTRADLAERVGYTPPLVDEVLELTAGRIGLDVELKEDGYVDRVVAAVVARHGAGEDVVVTSFLDEVVRQVKSNGHDSAPGCCSAAPTSRRSSRSPARAGAGRTSSRCTTCSSPAACCAARTRPATRRWCGPSTTTAACSRCSPTSASSGVGDRHVRPGGRAARAAGSSRGTTADRPCGMTTGRGRA